MELESSENGSGALYDVMITILQRACYVDIMSIRFADKKCYRLTIRENLWSHLIDRDFVFLEESDKIRANQDPETGYNIMRKYVFEYVLKIEREFGVYDNVMKLPSTLNPDVNKFLSNLGINSTDVMTMANTFRNPNVQNPMESIALSMENIMRSFDKTLPTVKNNMNNKSTLILSYRPTRRQQAIYYSLIEWREEMMKGKIPIEVVELITMDVLDLFGANPSQRQHRTELLIHTLYVFAGDIKYGMKLSILCTKTRKAKMDARIK